MPRFVFVLLLVGASSNVFGQDSNRPPSATMTAAHNERTIRYLVEHLFNAGQLPVADSLFEPAFAAEEKAFTTLLRGAFPDLTIRVNQLVAQNDNVAIHWTAEGTHRGRFLGVEATNKFARWSGSWFWTLRAGKVVSGKEYNVWDKDGLRKQLTGN